MRKNKGSPGIDGMTVDELANHLRVHWPSLREQLLAGSYQPSPVKEQLIPKSGGGMRKLGIPTVLDRFIQQALLQVLQPMFDPGFSKHSHGFRPRRRAHDAIVEAQRYIQEGRKWVVDVDLEQFFDRVNHDVLMGRLEKRIGDRRVLGFIRRYLNAGILANGVAVERHEGTPQGGPLSPLLANVLLDEVDKELEKRGHAFVRHADDCNVYVRSKRAGERVMGLLWRLYERLRLRVNESKSAVDLAWNRKLLGYSFWVARGRVVKRRVARKALAAMKERVRIITRRTRGRSIGQVVQELRSYLVGWKGYFRLTRMPGGVGGVPEENSRGPYPDYCASGTGEARNPKDGRLHRLSRRALSATRHCQRPFRWMPALPPPALSALASARPRVATRWARNVNCRAAMSPMPQRRSGVRLRESRPGDAEWIILRHGALYAAERGWDRRFEILVANIVTA